MGNDKGSIPEKTINDYVKNIESFIFRALRISDHSLCKEWIDIFRNEKGVISGTAIQSGVTLNNITPDLESLESLAARVRPVNLNDDPCNFFRTIKSLTGLLDLNENEKHNLNELRETYKNSFQSLSRGRTIVQGFDKSIYIDIDDFKLSECFLFGGLIHNNYDQMIILKELSGHAYEKSSLFVLCHAYLALQLLGGIVYFSNQGYFRDHSPFIEDILKYDPRINTGTRKPWTMSTRLDFSTG